MKCPYCKRKMRTVQDVMPRERIEFEAYNCDKCGEELMDMKQLGALAEKYRQLRKAKDTRFAKWGNSIAIRIPREIAGELGIKEGTQALIKKEKEGLKIIIA